MPSAVRSEKCLAEHFQSRACVPVCPVCLPLGVAVRVAGKKSRKLLPARCIQRFDRAVIAIFRGDIVGK